MTGPTTVANLFGHMGGRAKGLVQIWDVVGFDEVADLEKMILSLWNSWSFTPSVKRGPVKGTHGELPERRG
jgi:bacteriophage exclusion system BrxL-like protein